MSRAFFSNNTYPQPCGVQMDNNGKLVSIQHCHQADTYGVQSVQSEILKVKKCIGFFEAYKADTKLDISVRAEAAASIAEDEERLKRLESQNSCNIL